MRNKGKAFNPRIFIFERLKLRFSLEELAARFAIHGAIVSKQAINNWETGACSPAFGMRLVIQQVFNRPISHFITRQDDEGVSDEALEAAIREYEETRGTRKADVSKVKSLGLWKKG